MTAVVLVALWLAAAPPAAPAQVPERSAGGQTLRVTEADLDRHAVYYVQPGGDSQLVLRSRAPLQKVVVVGTRVVGYLLAPFELEKATTSPLLGGAFRVATASLRTAVDGGDALLHGASLLDAGRHPEITFLFTGLDGVRRVHHDQESTRYEGTLTGTLTLKGQARSLSLPVRLAFMPSTERIMARVDGDVLVLEGTTSFALRASGFEAPPDLQDRIADEVTLEVHLLLSTLSPDQPPDPRDDRAPHLERSWIATRWRDFGDSEGAATRARAHMQAVWDKPLELRRLAAVLIGMEGLRPAEWALAREAAARAVELTREEDARSLDALARVHAGMGDRRTAAEWQRKAVARAERSDARLARRMRETLAGYEGPP